MISRLIALALFLAVSAAFGQSAAESPTKINPLLIGAKAPDMTLKDQDGNDHQLSKLFGKKNTVIMFYRGGW